MIRNEGKKARKVVTNFNYFGRILSLNQADARRDQKSGPGKEPPGERECVMAKNKKTPTIGKAVADVWLAVTSQLFDSYRPELHYMRGPGPKWRAKHAQPQV